VSGTPPSGSRRSHYSRRYQRSAARAARAQQPRTGWRAVLHAAAGRPGRWLNWRRLVWLGCIALALLVIWEAGTHLGPGLRAAHGEGIPGLWTAEPGSDGGWTGEFVSSTGSVTLKNISYAGSVSNLQAGTVLPALDTGASNEVYPLTGSDKWIHDLIGVILGSLALIGLLARGFSVARRRRRAPPADYLTEAVGSADYLDRTTAPHRRRLGRRLPGRQSRPTQLVCVALGAAALGWASARFWALLAEARPYTGWYWPLALAAGIAVAAAPIAALRFGLRATARPARRPASPASQASQASPVRRRVGWAGWLLLGYAALWLVGVKFYLSVRFIPPPPGVPVAPPSPWFVLEMTGLAAEAVILAALTLLLLLVMAEIIAPGPVGGWVRARFNRNAPPPRHAQGFANTPDRDA
jgi:hypothetical protein